jgi:hypothetical protein
VTHPFHPFKDRSFEVLKVRWIAGRASLSLRHPDFGSFGMWRDWTDWAPPGTEPFPGSNPLLADAFALLQLAELAASLTSMKGLDA